MAYTFIPENRIDPRTAYANNVAFQQALIEVSPETRAVIEDVIDALAKKLVAGSKYMVSLDTGRRQASEAIAQIVMAECFDKLFVDRLVKVRR